MSLLSGRADIQSLCSFLHITSPASLEIVILKNLKNASFSTFPEYSLEGSVSGQIRATCFRLRNQISYFVQLLPQEIWKTELLFLGTLTIHLHLLAWLLILSLTHCGSCPWAGAVGLISLKQFLFPANRIRKWKQIFGKDWLRKKLVFQ